MSFSVKQGSEIVYTLPNNSGSTGDYLTSGGYGNNATWTTASDSHMYGQVITLWMSSTNFVNNNGGRSPKINDDVQRDWYYCNNDTIRTNSGAVVTVPDMRGCVIVGGRPNDNVISGGDHEISDAIPIPYHNHGLQASSGQWEGTSGTTEPGASFTFQHGSMGWNTARQKKGQGRNEGNVVNELTNVSLQSVNGTVQVDNHSHSVEVACGTKEYETQYAGGTEGDTDPEKTFKYYKLYYIIYLP